MNNAETAMFAWLAVHCLLTVVIWWRTDLDLEVSFMAASMWALMSLVLLPTVLKHIVLSYYRKVKP